jgi:hypothetical protein
VCVGFSFSLAQLFKVYINGNLAITSDWNGAVAMRAPNTPGTNGNTEFGVASTFGTYVTQFPYTGDMRWTYVWNRELSAQNFVDLFNNGNGQHLPRHSGQFRKLIN